MIKIPDLDTKFLATSKLLADMKSMNGIGREFTILIENFQMETQEDSRRF
jgi:hypothetical protein